MEGWACIGHIVPFWYMGKVRIAEQSGSRSAWGQRATFLEKVARFPPNPLFSSKTCCTNPILSLLIEEKGQDYARPRFGKKKGARGKKETFSKVAFCLRKAGIANQAGNANKQLASRRGTSSASLRSAPSPEGKALAGCSDYERTQFGRIKGVWRKKETFLKGSPFAPARPRVPNNDRCNRPTPVYYSSR